MVTQKQTIKNNSHKSSKNLQSINDMDRTLRVIKNKLEKARAVNIWTVAREIDSMKKQGIC